MSIKLHGYPVSNFYNKVKIALMEKEIPFTEERTAPSQKDEQLLAKSPVGRIPFIEHEGRIVFESTPILEYLESAFPDSPRLMPADPAVAARCREITTVIDLYIDAAVRPAYNALIGRTYPDEVLNKIQEKLPFAVQALSRIVIFNPYIGGNDFTVADCAAAATLSIVGDTAQILFGKNYIEEIDGMQDYFALINERPAVKKTSRAFKATIRAQKMSRS